MITSAANEMALDAPQHLRMLRLPQVCETTGLCRSSIYTLESEGRFPNRIKLSARAVAWIEREVQAWLAERIQISRPRGLRPL